MVRNVCTKLVVTAPHDLTVAGAARLMRANNVGTVVVVKDMHPVGILTDRDIVVEVVGTGKDPAITPLGDVMHQSLHVIRDTASIVDVTKRFGKAGVRRLPVVNELGEIVGIIAVDDLVILLGNEMAQVVSGLARGLKRGPD